MDRLLQNIRVAIRGIRRTPGFAATAILTLALGIGLSTAVFTVANGLLLRRLPVRDQDRIVVLWGEKRDGTFDHYPPPNDMREIARRAPSLERVASFAYEGAWPKPIREGDHISRLRRALVSGGFFDVLGAQPVLGRALRESDDVPGAAPVSVLAYATWQQRFGGDPRVLGRRILMQEDGIAYTIVGVMPRGLEFPRGTEFWAAIIPSTPPAKMRFRAVDVIARLMPGETAANAQQQMTAFFGRPGASPWERDLRGVVHTLPRLVIGDARPAVIVFAAAGGLLLLIACINVANLLLVRGLARVREIAVRTALGASRAQVTVQLLTEHLLLAVAGGALGLAIAAGAVRSFIAFAPADLPRLDEIQLNAPVLAGAVAITGVAMLLFGFAPALMASRIELQQVLRSDTRQSASRHSRLAAEGLAAGQVALALVVLSAAGLIARSLIKLERAELSFDPSRLLIAELTLRSERFDGVAKQIALLDRLVPRVRAIPGVRDLSPAVAIPFAGTAGWDGRLAVEGQSPEQATGNPMLNMEVVAPSYFSTLGMAVLRGRAFTDVDREGAPPVVVVSQSIARYFWPGEDPVGKRVLGPGGEQTLTVVGVVDDTRYRDLRTARPSVYFPLHQSVFPFAPMNLLIRTSGPPAELVATLRRVIADTDPGVALASAAPFDTFLDRPLAQPRLNALLLAVFACAAVLLAAVGLFGVMATMVRQRTRELGVRMALGATARDLQRMVMRRGLGVAATGSIVGLLGAFLSNRLLAAMLYEVSPTDGPTLAGVTGLLLGVAALASLIPARSSTRIDATISLRSEG